MYTEYYQLYYAAYLGVNVGRSLRIWYKYVVPLKVNKLC